MKTIMEAIIEKAIQKLENRCQCSECIFSQLVIMADDEILDAIENYDANLLDN